MTASFAKLFGLTLAAVLAVTGCRSDGDRNDQPPPQAAAPAAAPPAATQLDALHLVSFDLVKGPSEQLVGTFRRIDGATWEGPYPSTGAPVQWSARADGASLILYTENPRITTITLYTDTMDISSSAMDPADNHRVARAVFQ